MDNESAQYACLVTKVDKFEVPPVAEVLAREKKLLIADAALAARRCWGFAADNVEKSVSDRLAMALNSAGIGGIGILSLFISPISKKYIFTLCLIGILLAGLSWKFFLQDFQKSRIKIFLNPSMDLKGEGYNVRQAVVAVGSGKIFGKGLALGSQSQNKFLPERQTDFIFAASAEQIGFVGSWTLTFLYFFIAYRLLQIMKRAKDDLGYYIAGGVFFLFTIHALVNIGMNIGLLPVTGIPLPFLSAGGSFFLALMIGFGISQNISLQSKILRF
jgi:rod shape determining protein RodA